MEIVSSTINKEKFVACHLLPIWWVISDWKILNFCVRIFQGYYKNPEANKLVFDDEGFLRSGDSGYFDDRNLLYVVDRVKDIIKTESFQTNPSVIEDLISELDSVKLSCVVGVFDGLRNDICCAVVLKGNGKLTEDDVINHVNSKKFNRNTKKSNFNWLTY